MSGKILAKGTVFQIKITLLGTDPPVWRRVQTKDCSLAKLHDVIQTAMGWEDCHLYSFEVDGEYYEDHFRGGALDTVDSKECRIGDLVANGTQQIDYIYDWGDEWRHLVEIEETSPPKPGSRYPRCTEGERACPPEDCGGVWGYEELLETLDNPDDDPEGILEWIGDDFDPEVFDSDEVNRGFRR